MTIDNIFVIKEGFLCHFQQDTTRGLKWRSRELMNNNNKATKDLKKISGGQKITFAQDNAAGYAISERMQSQILSLNQDQENIQNGISMLKIAGGAENIIERDKIRQRYKYADCTRHE